MVTATTIFIHVHTSQVIDFPSCVFLIFEMTYSSLGFSFTSLGKRRAQFFISLLQRYSWEHEDKVANLWWIRRSNASPSKHLKGWAWKSYPPKITKRQKPNPENFLSHFYPPITSTCCRERVGSQNCPTLYNLVWVHTSLWSTLVIIGRLIKNLGLCFRE